MSAVKAHRLCQRCTRQERHLGATPGTRSKEASRLLEQHRANDQRRLNGSLRDPTQSPFLGRGRGTRAAQELDPIFHPVGKKSNGGG